MGRPRTIPRLEFSGIYQIFNLVNGKRYVGQAQNIFKRICEHHRERNAISLESRLYNAINKYGWKSFQFSVLEKIVDYSKLNEREEFWIRTLQTRDPKMGYNIHSGGCIQRGWNHNAVTKTKMSASKSNCFGENNPFYGKHHTKETKQRLRLLRLGKKWTKEQKARYKKPIGSGKPPRLVIQKTEGEQFIRQWKSISLAARTLGILQSGIVMVANKTPVRRCGKIYTRKTAGGYCWEYAERP